MGGGLFCCAVTCFKQGLRPGNASRTILTVPNEALAHSGKHMKSLYFISYAVMATMGAVIIGWAQYSRKKREGTPLNLNVIKALSGIAIAMWIAAGISAYVYNGGKTSDTVFMVGSVVGAVSVAFFFWQMLDVSRELDRNRKELKDLATRDALTHSWNRRLFEENFHAEIERAKPSGQALSLLMFDIDDFREVNEKYGYKVGDGILRELVGRIYAAIRLTDSVYRYGGEELALILPGSDIKAAERMAHSLTQSITDQPYEMGDQGPISIIVSIGVTALNDRTDTDDHLVENAIKGLKTAQSEPGNCVSVVP